MTTKRRQHALKTIDRSTIKQQLQWEDHVRAFIQDVNARNLSPRTSESYKESLNRLKMAFDEQQVFLRHVNLSPEPPLRGTSHLSNAL